MQRIHFIVRLFNFQLELEPSPQKNRSIKNLFLELNFAGYKKFCFSEWKVSTKKAQQELWIESTYTKQNPFFFHYRTDYIQLLEPKEFSLDIKLLDSKEKVILGSTVVSLHTLATGPEAYQLSIHQTSFNLYSKGTLRFVCQMYQECVIQYRIRSLSCPSMPLPAPILQHANSFWFQPDFTVEIWYISGERMTLVLKEKAARIPEKKDGKKNKLIEWNVSPLFYLSDTTDMLENAHFFLQFYYNDLPWGNALIPLFRDFDPKQKMGTYTFHSPFSSYYTPSSTFHFSCIEMNLEITNGPSFWPMKGGLVMDSVMMPGISKSNFPQPNLDLVHQDNYRFDQRWSLSATFPRITLDHLDDSQKTLLHCYFQMGFSQEWTTRHITNMIHRLAISL